MSNEEETTTTNNIYYLEVIIALNRGKLETDRSIRMPSRNNTREAVMKSEVDMRYIDRQVKSIIGGKIDNYTIKAVKTLNILSS